VNTTLAILAVVCFMLAIIAAGRRDAPTATAATTGALLFAILSIIVGDKDRRDC
jgi:hypothetical protein